MINSILLAATQATVPHTPTWSPTVGIIISLSCLVVLLLAGNNIKYPQVGDKMPFPLPGPFNNPSLGTFVASMAFGHVVGVGIVLAMANLGRL